MSWLYLAAIVGSGTCMGLVDRRWRLFLFRPGGARTALLVLLLGAAFFLAWDLVAIGLGVYERGASPGMTGIEVADELPLEELFFLVFLCYVTMVVHALVGHVLVTLERREVRR
jgi:lycopene cyclase domain-containing protein